MDLVKHTLFQTFNDDIILKYSLCKFGDPQVISDLGKKLSALIKIKLIKNKDYILYTTDILDKNCHKNSYLLAREINKSLGLDLVIGEYSFTYDKDNFYDNKSAIERKNHIPKIKSKKYSLEGKTFVIIDDSFFTGKTLSVIIQELEKYANNFLFFSIIDISTQKTFTEEFINSYFFEKEGIDGLIKIINKKGYIVTTHMIRTINKLSFDDKSFILSNINSIQKELLQKSYAQYIGEEIL